MPRARQRHVIDPDNTGKTLEFSVETRRVLSGCGRLQCTQEETAAMLGVSLPTLLGLFKIEPLAKILYRDSFAEGRVSLRRSQFRLAEKSAQMAIFLGKNWLGQVDRDADARNTAEITVKLVRFTAQDVVQGAQSAPLELTANPETEFSQPTKPEK